MKLIPSVISFLVFIIVIAIAPVVFQNDPGFIVPGFWTMFGFISALTFLVLIGMLIVKQKSQEYFTQAFLAGTTIKILVCLVFILIFGAKNPGNKHVFLVDFIYIYLLNTAFEIYVLLRNLRSENLR